MSNDKCLVYVDGVLDRDASMTAFQDYLDRLSLADNEVRSAVQAVFNRIAKGGSINMKGLITFACQELKATPANYSFYAEKIESYVSSNGNNENDGSVFRIARGKGGGVSLWKDYVSKK